MVRDANDLAGVTAHALDGALLLFDRATGWNARVDGPSVAHHRRAAPRVLHVGLSSRCNLDCGYCHRARDVASRWSLDAAVAWAKRFADAGTLEVVFGEGEPLMVPWFTELVRRLHDETPLAVGFTTNGTLLTRARHDAMRGRYGQLRVSAHDDNDVLARVRALRDWDARFGVNLLVTPARLDALDETLDALVDAGCDDVLALSYNGPDAALHLSRADDARLERTLWRFHRRHGARVSLKVSTCFGRRLAGLPTHQPWGDCGAGDDFVAIDAAWRVRGCSFHHGLVAVSSPDEALAAWSSRRMLRAPAAVRGCARPDAGGDVAAREGVTLWRAWASNNSSSYLLVGEFATTARAKDYVGEVERLFDRAVKHPTRTVWRLLGHEGEGPGALATRSGRELIADGVPRMLQRGPTVLAARSSTLRRFDELTSLLLLRHGRVLFHDDSGRWPWPPCVVGVECADAQQPLLRSALGADATFAQGAAWRVSPGREMEYPVAAFAMLRGQRAGFGPFAGGGVVAETLAEAIRSPVMPDDDARREVVLVRAWGDDPYTLQRVERLTTDPAACLAALGWTAPFRLPPITGAHALGRWCAVEVRGAVNAPLLWGLGLDRDDGAVFDARALRVVLTYPFDDDRRVTRRCADGAAQLARPGTVAARTDDGPENDDLVRVDVEVRDLAPLASLLRRQRARGIVPDVALMPARPLAVAVGRLLDGAMDRDDG